MHNFTYLFYSIGFYLGSLIMFWVYRENKMDRNTRLEPESNSMYYMRQFRPVSLLVISLIAAIILMVEFINS